MERQTQILKYGWKFRLYPEANAPEEVFAPEFDDSAWDAVRVPHDWAANGLFEITNDCSYSAVAADGITKPIEHSGRTGALPIVGQGVYRRWLEIPEKAEYVTLEFDGVMWDAHIYLGGKQVFFNHFGYKSFEVPLEGVAPGEKVLLAVSARVYEDCSRWYPGAGIYRNVRLVAKSAAHIRYHGIWLRQLEVTGQQANFELSVDYEGPETLQLQAKLFDPEGKLAATVNHGTYLGELSDIAEIKNPMLWDIEKPQLYTAEVTLTDEKGQTLDQEKLRFGIRRVEFTADHGFCLNGKNIKLNGVCNHHDLGSLGAALNVSALRRQLRLMKEMGVNAIRTSHNPPAPELLDLCDEMGFCVMDEMFDEWYMGKVTNGYSHYYRRHAAKDVEDTIRRDRNHPCVVLWSIGNEICEQGDPEGWRAPRMLSEVCHRMDPTRLTTAGLNCPDKAFAHHLTDYIDVIGINYKPHLYRQFHEEHPDVKLIGTETASCISTRGVYQLPAEIAIPAIKREDLTVSAYDMEAPGWAYYPEREWAAQEDCPFLAGEFVWTGMDYLGEPTPYYEDWPSRSSYFGVVDLAGLPKNRFYGYRARWTKEPVLHIFPHWNWEGHEGQLVPVHVYTNYAAVELFVNGKSYGIRSFCKEHELLRYRLIWDNVVYEPGTLKAVAYDAAGAAIAEQSICTAGKPHHVVLEADRRELMADGDDLVYVTAAIVDEKGVLCPHASDRIFFSHEGAGEFLTTDAGDQRECESFARADKKALSGKLVSCFRSKLNETGSLLIKAKAEDLYGAEVKIDVK